jgi:hypothetical protein
VFFFQLIDEPQDFEIREGTLCAGVNKKEQG